VTRDPRRRFTASEALQFLELQVIAKSSEDQLSISERPAYLDGPLDTYEAYDRWKGLPADFQREWAAYREPLGIPWMSRALRTLVLSNFLPSYTIPNIRWFITKLMFAPQASFTYIITFFAPSNAE
jgi:hypothetical protein